MSFISNRGATIPHSVIREMFALQTGMTDVISFALGEPDFDSPKHVTDAIIASLNRGETHYTPNCGIHALRTAVSEYYSQKHLAYAPEEIVIGVGAISVLNLACMAVLDIGDEVIIPDPGWPNYISVIQLAGAVPVPVGLFEKNNFTYNIEDLRNAISDKTKVILLNFPSNPTGGVASAENIKQIAELAIEKDLYVITDEIYQSLLWIEEPYSSIASIPGMKERTIIVDGFSKKYAMTGLRLAWAAAPEHVISTMVKLLENVFSCVNEGVQWGGVAALTGSQECVDLMKSKYIQRRRTMIDRLNAIERISCVEPKGAFYAFPNITRTGLSSQDFAMRLLKEKHVVVVPGTGFGANGEGFIRLSYATGEDTILRGLERIEDFIKSL